MTSLGLQDCNSALVMLQLAVLSELLSPVTELHSAQIRAEEAIDRFSISFEKKIFLVSQAKICVKLTDGQAAKFCEVASLTCCFI